MAWIRKRARRVRPHEAPWGDPRGRQPSYGLRRTESRAQLGEGQVRQAPSGRRGQAGV